MSASGSAPLRVLIVEDEALIAMELEWIVEHAGHVVIGQAADSAAAVGLATERKPDLALVDIHLLDGATGVDAARRIAGEVGALVVFTTANPKRIPDDYGLACGVIGKPYSECAMTAAIHYIAGCLRDGEARGEAPRGLEISPGLRTRWGLPDRAVLPTG